MLNLKVHVAGGPTGIAVQGCEKPGTRQSPEIRQCRRSADDLLAETQQEHARHFLQSLSVSCRDLDPLSM